MQAFQMKPLGFGEVLDGAFQIFRRHFVVLGLTTLIPSAVTATWTFFTLVRGTPADPAAAGGAWALIWWIGVMFLTLTMWGALSWQTSEAWIGGPVTLADGARAGLRSFFRMLGAVILCYLCVWAALVVVMIPFGILAAVLIPAVSAGGGGGAAGVILGLVLIPLMLIALIAIIGLLSFTLPAVIVEGLGPIRAIRRSQELASGAVLRSGAVIVVAGLIVTLPILAVMAFTGGFVAFTDPGAKQPATMLAIQQLAGLALGAFTTPFLAAVITVAYYDRRVRTEALDVQLAANQLQGTPEPV